MTFDFVFDVVSYEHDVWIYLVCCRRVPSSKANLTPPDLDTADGPFPSLLPVERSRDGSGLMFRPTHVLCKATALTPELLKSHLPPKWFSGLARPHVGMYPLLLVEAYNY